MNPGQAPEVDDSSVAEPDETTEEDGAEDGDGTGSTDALLANPRAF